MWPFKPKRKSQRGRTKGYQMAGVGRLTADWNVHVGSPNSEIIPVLRTMRDNSRDLAQNNDYARRFLSLLKTNVVGHKGIQFQNKAKDSNGKLDKGANDQIEYAWRDFCRKGNCTMDGGYSMTGACNTVIEAVARDGEILVQIVKSGKYGIAMHPIEADLLDERLNDTQKNIKGGVECDKWGRPVAYHLLNTHPDEYPGETYLRAHKRVRADNIIHVFLRERAGQTRGIPWLATPGYRMKMLGGIEEAELVASRVAASKMGFFITPDGDSYESDDTEAETPDAKITEAEPGTFEELPEGTDFKEWDPSHPNTAFEPFVKAILRGISSGLNVSYISLANDLTGVSYSSIRQGELSDRDAWRVLQRWLIEDFLEQIQRRWLPMALLSGALNLPARKLDKFDQPHWRPRGWNWVDPQKEIKSNVIAVQNGFRSLDDVLSESGHSVEEVFERLADEKALAEKYGLNLPVLFGEAKEETVVEQPAAKF